MPVDPFAFASVFANSSLLLSAGVACGYLGMRTFFQKRHALYLFFGYFALKMTTIALFDTLGWFGIGGDALVDVSRVLIVLLNVAMYPVVYYSWDASFSNVGIVAIFVDVICSFPMAIAMVLTNYLGGNGLEVGYIGYSNVLSVLRPVIIVCLFYPLFMFIKPLVNQVLRFALKREDVMSVAILVLVCAMAVSQFVLSVDRRTEGIFAFDSIPLPLLLAVTVSYALLKGRTLHKRRAYLARSKALSAACADAMRNQAAFLEGSRAMLDGLASRIGQLEAPSARENLGHYLDDLRATCDRLRFGTYSDSPTLDVVLIGYEEKFAQAGVRVKYRVSPLSIAGEDVAIAAQTLLEWAFQLCMHRKSSKAGLSEMPDELAFRAFRRANQVFLEVRVPLWDGLQHSQRLRTESLPATCSVVFNGRETDALALRLLLQEVHA